ncbi:MAG: DnaB-like helicase C-terminal domain-containing protein, partial [Bacteroidales bacterium]
YKIMEDAEGHSLVGMAEIIVAKHRNGSTGDVRLRFKSQFAKFCNVDDDIDIGPGMSSIISSRINNEKHFADHVPQNFSFGGESDNSVPF